MALAVSAAAASATPAFTAASASATSLARDHGAGFIHHQRAAHEITAVAGFDGAICRGIVVDLDEPEPARFAREAIAHDIDTIHCDTGLREEIRHIGFGSRIGQVPYEKFHGMLLDFSTEAGLRPRTRENEQG